MEKSKNRMGLTKVKAIFLHINKKYRHTLTAMKVTLKNIVSRCVVRSEHHTNILSAKLIGKEHLSKLTHLSKRLFLFGIQ